MTDPTPSPNAPPEGAPLEDPALEDPALEDPALEDPALEDPSLEDADLADADLTALPPGASDLDRDRALIIQQVRDSADAELLWRLREALSEHGEARAEGHLQGLQRQALRWHLERGVEARLDPAPADAAEALLLRTTPLMFGASVASLCVLGLALMLLIEPYLFVAPPWLHSALGAAWWALVAASTAELAAFAWARRRAAAPLPRGVWFARALAAALPPLRMGLHLPTQPELMWLPRLGWVRANQALFEKLRDDFAPMMIAVSLLILPLLVVELRYEDAILQAAPWLPLFALTQTCQAFIWVAFAFEFIVMASVHDDRAEYVQMNWIDALIILFPLLSFFRLARVVQLARGYRLRVLLTRLRQAAILTRVLRRFALITPPERQLARMRRRLRVNHRERQEIEHMIYTLVRRAEDRRRAKAALAARRQQEALAAVSATSSAIRHLPTDPPEQAP